MSNGNAPNDTNPQNAIEWQKIVDEVCLQTENAISNSEQKILAGIQAAVANAVETKYKVVIAQLGTDSKNKDKVRTWEVFTIILPILLTIGLGYWVFLLQKDVEGKMDEQKQDLTTRLALTQEYQKRKVAVYELCAKDMSMLVEGLELLRIDPADQKQSSDSVHDLYECAINNPLYITKQLSEDLSVVRSDAITALQAARSGSMNVGAVEHDIDAAEEQMKEELLATTVRLGFTR